MIGAGLRLRVERVATKLAADDIQRGHLPVAALWVLSTAGASAVGALSEMSALQERPAIQVAPVVFVTQTVVPVVARTAALRRKHSPRRRAAVSHSRSSSRC